ncbi:MAG: hypothetical protein U0Q19_00170 [Kineosporiaceae bacterium]
MARHRAEPPAPSTLPAPGPRHRFTPRPPRHRGRSAGSWATSGAVLVACGAMLSGAQAGGTSRDAALTRLESMVASPPVQAAPPVDLERLERYATVTVPPSATSSGTTSAAVTSPVAPTARPAPLRTHGGDPVPAVRIVPPGLPAGALAAYRGAADWLARTDPGCHLTWSLLAAIGTVESDNGRFGGAVLGPDGVARPPILGIRLDGTRPGTARVTDTDGGRLDGDPVYDRAVGPMQFLPGTWAAFARSADPGRPADPQNIRDAALTAAGYLCHGGADLADPAGLRSAVLRYNNSPVYADTVIRLAAAFAAGRVSIGPTAVASSPTGRPSPTPSSSAVPTTSRTPSPSSSASPSLSPSASPSPSPSPSPSASPSVTPSDTTPTDATGSTPTDSTLSDTTPSDNTATDTTDITPSG